MRLRNGIATQSVNLKSFLEGASSMWDFSIPVNIKRSVSSEEALRSDWDKIGNDFRNAIKRVQGELNKR